MSDKRTQYAIDEDVTDGLWQQLVDDGEGRPDGTESLKRLDKTDVQDRHAPEVCRRQACAGDDGLSYEKRGDFLGGRTEGVAEQERLSLEVDLEFFERRFLLPAQGIELNERLSWMDLVIEKIGP